MLVRLIGTNVELSPVSAALSDLPAPPILSPEPIAAAYARISRSPKTVAELREEARHNVQRARKSNEKIVFEMGHSSIAEHAVFNFDVEGVSRLAIERIEATRVASYTERSQRYVLIGKDFVVPEEVSSDRGLTGRFEAAVLGLMDAYGSLHDALAADSGDPEQQQVAREDARYVLPLAAAGQLGITVNARSLGNMARRLKASRLAEMRTLGALLEQEGLSVAPSLIRHTQPRNPDPQPELLPPRPMPPGPPRLVERPSVSLVHATPPGAEDLLARHLPGAAGSDPFSAWFAGASAHAKTPRCFELADLLFEVVCSASCFAQLKRHRMATILPEPYDPGLPVMVPGTLVRSGRGAAFTEALSRVAPVYSELADAGNPAAVYLLTNAHCRKVLFKCNLRELYHFSRLRMDAHAQWEIRDLAGQMAGLARAALPRAAAFLGGKDAFGRTLC